MALTSTSSQSSKSSTSQFACQLLEAGRPRYVVVRFKNNNLEAYDIANKTSEFRFPMVETELELESGPRPGTTGLCVLHKLSSKAIHLVGPSKTISGMLQAFTALIEETTEERSVPTYRYRATTQLDGNRRCISLPTSGRSSGEHFRHKASVSTPVIKKLIPGDDTTPASEGGGKSPQEEDPPAGPPHQQIPPPKGDARPPSRRTEDVRELEQMSGKVQLLEGELSSLSSELAKLRAERDDLRMSKNALIQDNAHIQRQVKELTITTEELEERLKQPVPSLLSSPHDEAGVDQILLQMQKVLTDKSLVLAEKSQLQRYVVDLEERVYYLENEQDTLLTGFNEEMANLHEQKAKEIARMEVEFIRQKGGGGYQLKRVKLSEEDKDDDSDDDDYTYQAPECAEEEYRVSSDNRSSLDAVKEEDDTAADDDNDDETTRLIGPEPTTPASTTPVSARQVVDSVVGDQSDRVLSEEDIDKEDDDDDYDSVDGDSSVDSDPKRRIPRGFWQVLVYYVKLLVAMLYIGTVQRCVLLMKSSEDAVSVEAISPSPGLVDKARRRIHRHEAIMKARQEQKEERRLKKET